MARLKVFETNPMIAVSKGSLSVKPDRMAYGAGSNAVTIMRP